MGRFKKILLTAAAASSVLTLFFAEAPAGEFVAVIVNKANPQQSLTMSDIKKIYSNTILKWPDGEPITMYDLMENDPVREEFSGKVFGKPSAKVAEEWAHLKITNQAKNPPTTMKSQALIIRRVATERGAIGYVSLSKVKESPLVRIMTILE